MSEIARQSGNPAIARAVFEAYAAKDREAIEQLIAPGFTFTSPLDNGIDRATYFERCWPNSEWIAGYEYIRIVPAGDQVVVTYEGRSTRGPRFRNTEVLTVLDEQVTAVEVYFGWSVPHRAEAGRFVETQQA